MAREQITYKCGHEGVVNLDCSSSIRRRKIKWMEATLECPFCQGRHAAERNAEKHLPPLSGTERQAAWAEWIRDDSIPDDWSISTLMRLPSHMWLRMRETCRDDAHMELAARAAQERYMECVGRHKSSRWWIDHRDSAMDDLLWEMAESMGCGK